MRNIIFICAFIISLFSTMHVYSQTEKGRLIYGAGVSFSYSPSFGGINFAVAPQFGGFVAKNLAVLSVVSVNTSFYGLFYGMGPELRYYIGGEKVKFFLFGNVEAGGIYSYYNGQSKSRFGLTAGGGPGIAVFAGPNFSIHASLYGGYQRNFGNSVGEVFIGLGTTFNGLLTPKKKE